MVVSLREIGCKSGGHLPTVYKALGLIPKTAKITKDKKARLVEADYIIRLIIIKSWFIKVLKRTTKEFLCILSPTRIV